MWGEEEEVSDPGSAAAFRGESVRKQGHFEGWLGRRHSQRKLPCLLLLALFLFYSPFSCVSLERRGPRESAPFQKFVSQN